MLSVTRIYAPLVLLLAMTRLCTGEVQEADAGFLTNLVHGLMPSEKMDDGSVASSARSTSLPPTEVKIVLGGLARTGMESVNAALEILNFTVLPGMPDILDVVAEEMKVMYTDKTLDEVGFIEAMGQRGYEVVGYSLSGKLNAAAARIGLKVILPIAHESAEEWAESMVTTIALNYDNGRRPPFTWLLPDLGPFAWELKAGINDGDGSRDAPYDRSVMMRNYHEHFARVKEMVPSQNLLVIDVRRDGWAPLCAFVDVPNSACPLDTPFPHKGKRADVMVVIYAFAIIPWIWPLFPTIALLMGWAVFKRCCRAPGTAVMAVKKGL